VEGGATVVCFGSIGFQQWGDRWGAVTLRQSSSADNNSLIAIAEASPILLGEPVDVFQRTLVVRGYRNLVACVAAGFCW
jgi:hypothetical protein